MPTKFTSIEARLNGALDYMWAVTGKIDPEKFAVGVSHAGWEELGGNPKTPRIEFTRSGKTFEVLRISGLTDDAVAFIWL